MNCSCSPWAKAIIQRCIGERRRRYANADELLKALEKPRRAPGARRSVIRLLQGKRVVFTGRMTLDRKTAARLLKMRAGGIVQAQVSRTTDVVVLGSQSPHWKAEKKGQKLLDLDYEQERGHRIAVISGEALREPDPARRQSDPPPVRLQRQPARARKAAQAEPFPLSTDLCRSS